MLRMGIDLGGTKIEAMVMDEHGQTLKRERILTPQNDYQEILRSIKALIDRLEQEVAQPTLLGFGTPGALTDEGLLKNSNTLVANGKPIFDDLRQILGREIRMMNDANCFALSEAIDGAGQGHAVVFGVIVGTGVGAGVIINGQALIGPNRIAGEWGHNPLPWQRDDERPGAKCYCGKQACIETFLSGPGMSLDYERLSGETLTPDQIVQSAEAGDNKANTVVLCYEDRMARALAHVINILDPDVIVLGGGMSNIKRLYNTVPERWGEYVFSDVVHTKLLSPKFGDSSGVRGAAWLWEA